MDCIVAIIINLKSDIIISQMNWIKEDFKASDVLHRNSSVKWSIEFTHRIPNGLVSSAQTTKQNQHMRIEKSFNGQSSFSLEICILTYA